MDKDCEGKLASFLEGGDVVCPPGTKGSLGISVFLFTHRSVVGEGLRIRGRHPWLEGGGTKTSWEMIEMDRSGK